MADAKHIQVYDTTLRDGCQSEDVSLTIEDKVTIAERLDELGFDYIEGGWPGSNERDAAFFKQIKKSKLHHAKIAAFGSTRRAPTAWSATASCGSSRATSTSPLVNRKRLINSGSDS